MTSSTDNETESKDNENIVGDDNQNRLNSFWHYYFLTFYLMIIVHFHPEKNTWLLNVS